MNFLDKLNTVSTKIILFVIAPLLFISAGVIGILFLIELLGNIK